MKTLKDLQERLIDMINSGFNYIEAIDIMKMNKWELHRIELNTLFIQGYRESNIVSYEADDIYEEGIYRLQEVKTGDAMWIYSDGEKVSYIEPEKVIDRLIAMEREATIKMILE